MTYFDVKLVSPISQREAIDLWVCPPPMLCVGHCSSLESWNHRDCLSFHSRFQTASAVLVCLYKYILVWSCLHIQNCWDFARNCIKLVNFNKSYREVTDIFTLSAPVLTMGACPFMRSLISQHCVASHFSAWKSCCFDTHAPEVIISDMIFLVRVRMFIANTKTILVDREFACNDFCWTRSP